MKWFKIVYNLHYDLSKGSIYLKKCDFIIMCNRYSYIERNCRNQYAI